MHVDTFLEKPSSTSTPVLFFVYFSALLKKTPQEILKYARIV
jgi:hypothetical protein